MKCYEVGVGLESGQALRRVLLEPYEGREPGSEHVGVLSAACALSHRANESRVGKGSQTSLEVSDREVGGVLRS